MNWVLEENEVARLTGRKLRGRVLTCVRGEVMVTFAGCARDHVLTAGESLELPAAVDGVVWAFARAEVGVAPLPAKVGLRLGWAGRLVVRAV